VLGADPSEECRFATLLVICVAMTSQPGILRFAVGIGEEQLSMSIKRCWRVAIAILGAVAYVAGTPALPQVSRDSEEGCARQAETVFRARGYSKDITRPKGDTSGNNDVIANFESHYNTVLNKCFMLLEIFGVGTNNAGFQIRSLLDAYEGRTYAEFAWGPTESSKSAEVRPYCRLMASSDDQSNCHSEAEFNTFVDGYIK
jgi:hypothetical protein